MKVEKNNQIGRLDRWGPLYRVSLELRIHSLTEGNKYGWSNILAFREDSSRTNIFE